MLVIGRALMSDPKVILLDEPSLGLAPLLVEEIFGIVRRLRDERSLTVLLVEQNAALALDIADHGYVMENGRIVLEGPADTLRQNSDIKEFYLGLNDVGTRKSYRDVKHYKRRKALAVVSWRLACSYAVSDGVPRRSLWVALVVGTVLNLINQGDTLLAGRRLDLAKLR